MQAQRVLGSTLAVASVLLGLTAALGAQATTGQAKQAAPGTTQHADKNASAPDHSVQDAPDNGDEVYAQNCSRCHTAPEAMNHRITGTVLRHMRTRANLSEADEKALLKFFAGQ